MNIEVLARRAQAERGTTYQLDMVIEECAELIDSIQKYRRNRVDFVAVLEEGVDVELMIEQLKIILGENTLWENMRARKLKLLEELLEGEV